MSERELIKRCADVLQSAGTTATNYMDWINEAGEVERLCREYLAASPNPESK